MTGPTGDGSHPRSRGRTMLACAALLLVLLAAYRPALHGDFVWDDLDFIVETSWFDAADGLRQIWLDPSSTSQYYPLTYSSHWLEHRVFGRDTTGYHVDNVLLHAANAVLLWLVLRRLAVPGALLAAALFALHPVQVESVAWISERKNVLSGLFFLAALLAWLRASPPDEEPARLRPGWYLLCLTLYVAALLAKSVTCALPAVVLLLIWWKRGRVAARELAALVPLFAIGAGAALLTVWLERNQVGASGVEFQLGPLDRVAIAGRALWFYAGKLVWPTSLAFIYPRWPTAAERPGQLLFAVAFVVVVALLWWRRARIGRGPLVAVLLFAGILLPALGFVDVYPMRYSFVADHFQYLASAALLTLVAALATTLARRLRVPARVAGALGVALCLVLTVLTFRQSHAYANAESLWRDTLAKNPGSWMAMNNLAYELERHGRPREAVPLIRAAIRVNPNCLECYGNLASAYRAYGDEASAKRVFADLGMFLLRQRLEAAGGAPGAAPHSGE